MKAHEALAILLLASSCTPAVRSAEEPEEEPATAVSPPLVGPARWHEYPEADALRYDVDLVIDPATETIEGTVHYRFRALRTLSEVRLDSVYGGEWSARFFQSRELAIEQVGDQVHLRLENEVPAGAEVTFRAELLGHPPDGLYFSTTRYGRPCVYTDHYSVRARGWLPCEDHPDDRAVFSLRLAVPEGYDAVFSGSMHPATSRPDKKWPPDGMVGWEGETITEIPTYLFAVAVTRYARLSERGDPRLVPHYVYPEDVAMARASLQHHAAWMRRMEETFGPYPFAKYCVAQIPTRWGGMENAGNTWVNEGFFEEARGGVGTLAHELVHQWFGDGVGYADWYEAWLSEGFASYFGPWLDEATGGPTLRESMVKARETWLAAPEGRTQPVRWICYERPDEALNANSYPKGAWVLHMLRHELGDSVFFRGIRDYYVTNAGRAARTRDLRQAMERTSKRDLGWFFEEWLDRPGCPELRFQWTDTGVLVQQVQDATPYEFLLPLRWVGAGGEVHDQDFRITERDTVLELDGAPIRAPVVDPDVELLYREASP